MNPHSFPHAHIDRIRAAISDNAEVTALASSWRRSSIRHKLDPAESKPPRRLTEFELGDLRQSIETLLRIAQPSLDRLYAAVHDVGCCVVLADSNGIVVDRRGNVADDATFWPGSVWSEESEGTNGIGTCLVEGRPVTIHGDQHYFARNRGLSCTSAPIHGHLGNVVAVLGVSSCQPDLLEGFIRLISIAVADAARRIEAEHFRASYPKARIQLVPVPGSQHGALVAVDCDDLVIGASRSMRLALGLPQTAIETPFPLASLLGDAAASVEDLIVAERRILRNALSRASGNVSVAAKALGISRATLHRKLKKLEIEYRN